MNKSDTIVINGRQYDIKTGNVIQQNKKKLTNIREFHDVFGPSKQVAKTTSLEKVDNHKKLKVHKIASHRSAHQRQHSKTLLRNAVKKPSLKNNQIFVQRVSPALDRQGTTESTAIKSHVAVKAARLERSQNVSKSQFVQRYNGLGAPSSITDPPVETIEVRQAPNPAVEEKPPQIQDQDSEIKEAPNPFDTAVARAHSHEEQYDYSATRAKRGRLFRYGSVVFLFLVVAAAVLYVKRPSLDVSLADYRARIVAVMPTRLPSGYNFQSPANYSPGNVTLTYTNQTSYIKISESYINSSTSRTSPSVSSLSAQAPTVISSNSVVVYRLVNNDSIWITNNIEYQLSSNSWLSNNDLLNIASSV